MHQAMEVDVTKSSGTKTKTMVKAFDPLAENGALYYSYSKTKMYGEIPGEWFYCTWYEVVVPIYQNVLPMLNISTLEELDSILETWTVISLCKSSVILSDIVT